MSRMHIVRTVLLVATLIAFSGCASVKPAAYQNIESSSYLQPDNEDDHMPYQYSPRTDWRRYRNLIIEPVVIYQGRDHQFGDMSNEDKSALAHYMYTTFAEKLRARFRLVDNPGPDTLVLKLTLTGADTSTPVLATLSRFDIAGGLYNTYQAATGGEGAFTGFVLYAVELFDSTSSRLLSAYVTKQYPNPWNLGAGIGGLSAAEVGLDKGADALAERLQ